ncbi:MAG: tRNA threonylcarbamoyladenosine dehydratase [Oxalobacter sp.]|nr:tRNA threonylcarbamoyladenosine dehydratase [Oxalobacter sp.]
MEEGFDATFRFAGIVRLYGQEGFERLQKAAVCVVGNGGVGSWAVESLARSGVGRLILIDGDTVAETNINRQIQALASNIGKPKVTVLAERIAQINPACQVEALQVFINAENLPEIIGARRPDFVIDAIDNVTNKTELIVFCKQHQIPLLASGGAGGKTDPTRIEICDLTRTQQEPLLAKVRKRLRNEYGFPRSLKTKFWIDAVYSSEPIRYPTTVDGGAVEPLPGMNPAGFGTAMPVTAGFGLAAASYVLRKLALTEQ